VIERRFAVGFRAEARGTVDENDVADIVFKVDATDLQYFWNHFAAWVGGAGERKLPARPDRRFHGQSERAVPEAQFELALIAPAR
jgi:hypothetical protein